MLERVKQGAWPTNEEDIREISFAVGQLAKKVHSEAVTYHILPFMKKELVLI